VKVGPFASGHHLAVGSPDWCPRGSQYWEQASWPLLFLLSWIINLLAQSIMSGGLLYAAPGVWKLIISFHNDFEYYQNFSATLLPFVSNKTSLETFPLTLNCSYLLCLPFNFCVLFALGVTNQTKFEWQFFLLQQHKNLLGLVLSYRLLKHF
jgi:hypothetical protein